MVLDEVTSRRLGNFIAISIIVSWLSFPAEVIGQITFGNEVDFAIGAAPGPIAIGDFNVDGKNDIAVASTSSNDVTILLGNGDGTFQRAASYPVGTRPVGIAIVDLNSDLRPDLAIAFAGDISSFAPGGVTILLGNGNGNFQNSMSLASSDYPSGVASGDFNGDQKPDLAISTIDGPISVYLGNGDGTFHNPVNYTVTGDATSVALGDFNFDQRPDIAVTTLISVGSEGLDGRISILLGNGDGSFQAARETLLGGASWSGSIGDFNNDQKPDVAFLLKPGSVFGVATEAIALGNGDGTFSQPRIVDASSNITHSVTTVDLNQDGISDVVGLSADLRFYLGRGDGTFQAAQIVTFSNANPQNVSIADLNGDGLPDLAATMLAQGVASVLLNTTSDFVVSATPLNPNTVSAGQSATSVLTVTSANGFNGTISLSCSIQVNSVDAPTCAVNPASASPGSSVTLTVSTTAPMRSASHSDNWLYASWILLFGLFCGREWRGKHNRHRIFATLLCISLLGGIILHSGCGGSQAAISGGSLSGGTPAGSYAIAVTSISGKNQHTTGLVLKVH